MCTWKRAQHCIFGADMGRECLHSDIGAATGHLKGLHMHLAGVHREHQQDNWLDRGSSQIARETWI